MEIKLQTIKLENFKGIKKFKFAPHGKNGLIKGDNATGKTTVADAFRWLLFGKDTHDKADFQLKTVDHTGKEKSNIDHTVSGVIEVDGKNLELKKVYKEKWTKKRGDSKKALTGHTTDHFIDGVPTQKKEWDKRMAGIIDEDVFKLVTLPTYFNSLHWQKRREILLQVCGDVSDEDVINSDPALDHLFDILKNHSLDDHRKIVQAEKKKINDRLKEIPARIDELIKSLPQDVKNRKAVEAYIALIDKKIEKARDDTELSELRKQLADVQTKLSEAKAEDAKALQEVNAGIDDKIYEAKAKIRELKFSIAENQSSIEASQKTIESNIKNMTGLRSKFTEIQAQAPQYDEICPTCNQPYPKDQIEAVKSRFLENQAEEMTRINEQGKAFKAENEALHDIVKEGEKEILTMEANIETCKSQIDEWEKGRITQGPMSDINIENLQIEVNKLANAIEDHPTPDISGLEAERREEQEKLAILDAAEKTKARIEELKAEEKKLSAKFEDLESQIFLMEKFIVQKVNMLEDKINSKFQFTKFKLFETQINEGIRECCVAMVDGVPHGSGLNKGMEINSGLDIIRTLSDHYGVRAPVWIDNAEAVTSLLEIPSQTFKLMVHPDYPKMEVEVG